MGLHDLHDAMVAILGDQSSPRGTEDFLCKHFVLFLKKYGCRSRVWNQEVTSCTLRWDGHVLVQSNEKNVAHVLDNNIIKFPKDVFSYCSVNQHGHMKTENAGAKHSSRRLVNPCSGLFDNQVLFFFLYIRISASLKVCSLFTNWQAGLFYLSKSFNFFFFNSRRVGISNLFYFFYYYFFFS